MKSYIAQGEVLDIDPKSFGSIGIIAISEMGRFYRHVLIEKGFPKHASMVYKHTGSVLYEVMKMLGINDIGMNLPAGTLYKTENPF